MMCCEEVINATRVGGDTCVHTCTHTTHTHLPWRQAENRDSVLPASSVEMRVLKLLQFHLKFFNL